MDRREFTKLLLMSAAGTILAGCGADSLDQKSERILIIGAGIAGISAARNLHDSGYSVTVLEGRDRIGGRVWTSRKWSELPVDMGASWIHGVRGNPLTQIADEIDAPRLETDYDNMILYSRDGDLQPDRVWSQIEEYEAKIMAAISDAAWGDEDVSIADAVAEAIDLEALSERDRQYIELIANNYYEHEWAADVSELSSSHIQEGAAFGGSDVIFPDGYGRIVEYLAADLDIRLNEEVTEIQYGEDGIRASSSSGTFEADRIIVTLPIGVLKSDAVTFKPALPAFKRDAINAIGIGVLNKVYLKFAEPFWQKAPEWIGYIPQTKGEFSAWLNYYHYTDEPALLAFNAGKFGKEVENLSDAEIVSLAMQTLQTMYGDDIDDPVDFQITRWHSDPFARCSYSAPVVGMSGESRADLAEPVQGKILFAGEATHVDYPATVHGAYLSGQREAERIKELG